MPEKIIFDIPKEKLNEILSSQEGNKITLKVNVQIEVTFSSESELKSLKRFIQENKKLEYLKINLPGSFNFEDVLTDELIKEQVPNLKITIQEKFDNVATTTSFNEFS